MIHVKRKKLEYSEKDFDFHQMGQTHASSMTLAL